MYRPRLLVQNEVFASLKPTVLPRVKFNCEKNLNTKVNNIIWRYNIYKYIIYIWPVICHMSYIYFSSWFSWFLPSGNNFLFEKFWVWEKKIFSFFLSPPLPVVSFIFFDGIVVLHFPIDIYPDLTKSPLEWTRTELFFCTFPNHHHTFHDMHDRLSTHDESIKCKSKLSKSKE